MPALLLFPFVLFWILILRASGRQRVSTPTHAVSPAVYPYRSCFPFCSSPSMAETQAHASGQQDQPAPQGEENHHGEEEVNCMKNVMINPNECSVKHAHPQSKTQVKTSSCQIRCTVKCSVAHAPKRSKTLCQASMAFIDCSAKHAPVEENQRKTLCNPFANLCHASAAPALLRGSCVGGP